MFAMKKLSKMKSSKTKKQIRNCAHFQGTPRPIAGTHKTHTGHPRPIVISIVIGKEKFALPESQKIKVSSVK